MGRYCKITPHGHYLLPLRLTERNYLFFLLRVSPQILGEELISKIESTDSLVPTQWNPWPFKQKCLELPKCHILSSVDRAWLSRKLACSVDRPIMSFFYFWRHMKTLVYDTLVDNAEELVAKIAVAAGRIRDMRGLCRLFGFSYVRDVRCEW